MQYTDKEILNNVTKLLLVVQGGIGRNFTATAVIRELKRTYPEKDICVLAGCPELFLKNPSVKRVHNLSHPSYVFEDYIKDNRTLILNVEPYQHYGYIYRQKHFAECWCDMLGIECRDIAPEIFFNNSEIEMAKDYLKKFNRRMVLIQHQGGKIPEKPDTKSRLIAQSGMYKRNLPENVTQDLTNALIDMGYMVGSIGHKNQFLPKGAQQISFPIRAITALIPHVEAIITIDSFLLHASACFKNGTPTMALWGGTNPVVLGYPWHTNIVREVCDNPMCHRPNSYLWDFEETGFLWDCPHNDICMNYKADEIIKEFKKITKPIEETKNDGTESGKETCTKDKSCGQEDVPCKCEGNAPEEVPAGVRSN